MNSVAIAWSKQASNTVEISNDKPTKSKHIHKKVGHFSSSITEREALMT